MPTTTRTSELVIRARDAASRIFRNTAQASDAFSESLQSAQLVAGALSSTLTLLGNDLQRLQAATGGRNLRFAEDLTRAGMAVRPFVAGLRTARQTVDQYGQAARVAGGGLRSLRRQQADTAVAVQRQLAAVSAARTELRQLNLEAERAGGAQGELAEDITRAETKYQELHVTLSRLTSELRRIDGAIKQQDRSQRLLNTSAAQSTQSFERQNRSLRTAATSLTTIRNVARRAVRAIALLDPPLTRLGFAGRAAAEGLRRATGEAEAQTMGFRNLRSEVFSLVAAYVSLFGLIQSIRSVIDASLDFERVQNRLAVVTEGDVDAQRQELDFLRRTSDRLGFSLAILADNYSSLAIASKGTVLEGQRTRELFLAIATAARVLGLEQQTTNRVFTATTQVLSKGRVAAEELRQQIGEQLTGAFQLFAAGLRVSTTELDEMLQRGEVGLGDLVGFADALNERFAGQLPASLETATASLGRFRNQLFQALLVIGEGGALDGVQNLLDSLTETLSSPEFESFARRLGTVFGAVANVLGFVVDNFRVLLTLLAARAAVGIVPTLLLLIGGARFLPQIIAAGKGLLVMARNALTASAGVGRLSVTSKAASLALRGLTIAVRAFATSLILGGALAAIGVLLGGWATSADAATEALNRHRRVVDQIRNAYDQAGDNVEDLRQNVENLTVAELRRNVQALDELVRRREAALSGGNLQFDLRAGNTEQFRAVTEVLTNLDDQFSEGRIGLIDYLDELDKVAEEYQSIYPSIIEVVTARQAEARGIVMARVALNEANLALVTMTGSEQEAAEAARQLGNTLLTAADAQQRQQEATEKFEQVMRQLAKNVPLLRDELEQLEEVEALEKLRDRAIELAKEAGVAEQKVHDLFDQVLLSRDIERQLGGSGGGAAAAFRLISQETDRTAEQVSRSVLSIQNDLAETLGPGVFDALAASQQAALTRFVDNFGPFADDIRDRVRQAVAEGDEAAVGDILRDLGDEAGAAIFETGEIDTTQILQAYQRIEEAVARLEERRAQAAQREEDRHQRDIERAREATRESLEQGVEELNVLALRKQGLEVEAAVLERLQAERRANANITDEELEQIEAQVRARHALENVGQAAAEQARQAAEAESRVNDLLNLRSALQQELNALAERGLDPARQQELNDAINLMGEEIRAAAEEAIRLLEAMQSTDPAIAALIARLKAVSVETERSKNAIILTGQAVQQAFGNQIGRAFDTFIDRLTEGRNIIKSIGAAFRQFAAQFLQDIARMIVQQLALNAAKRIFNALGGGGGGGGVGGFLGRIFGAQTGALVGTGGRPIRLPSPGRTGFGGGFLYRLHEGEEVLTRSDPRNIRNAGAGNLNLTVIDNAGVQVSSASARLNSDGEPEIQIELDRLVADTLQSGPLTTRVLAGLGAAPPLEGR